MCYLIRVTKETAHSLTEYLSDLEAAATTTDSGGLLGPAKDFATVFDRVRSEDEVGDAQHDATSVGLLCVKRERVVRILKAARDVAYCVEESWPRRKLSVLSCAR